MSRVNLFFLIWLFTSAESSIAQNTPAPEIAFISDTQAPLWIEKIFRKTHHNKAATARLLEQIIQLKPRTLFIAGDVTAWSATEKYWQAMDSYLKRCRSAGIPVHALLGNHDVMGSAQKGERNFLKRFPDTRPTGFVCVIDSMAFVLVNSNFQKMKPANVEFQQKWYQTSLDSLTKNPAIKCIVVSCHHAPYSNSKEVGSSKPVQEHFVPLFMQTRKCRLFITGHAHAFEHFNVSGKDFLVIGGGGGIHQRLGKTLPDLNPEYKPMFHFLTITRDGNFLKVDSYSLKDDLSPNSKMTILALPIGDRAQ
jgi:Icc-related predicted phosphoesterase